MPFRSNVVMQYDIQACRYGDSQVGDQKPPAALVTNTRVIHFIDQVLVILQSAFPRQDSEVE
jgi:hypothetical protein